MKDKHKATPWDTPIKREWVTVVRVHDHQGDHIVIKDSETEQYFVLNVDAPCHIRSIEESYRYRLFDNVSISKESPSRSYVTSHSLFSQHIMNEKEMLDYATISHDLAFEFLTAKEPEFSPFNEEMLPSLISGDLFKDHGLKDIEVPFDKNKIKGDFFHAQPRLDSLAKKKLFFQCYVETIPFQILYLRDEEHQLYEVRGPENHRMPSQIIAKPAYPLCALNLLIPKDREKQYFSMWNMWNSEFFGTVNADCFFYLYVKDIQRRCTTLFDTGTHYIEFTELSGHEIKKTDPRSAYDDLWRDLQPVFAENGLKT